MSNRLAVDLAPHVEDFFGGGAGALGAVYGLTHEYLTNLALKAGADSPTDAEDAASDAIMYVRDWRRRRENTTGSQLFGMLSWAAKIMVRRQRSAAGRVITFSTQDAGLEDDLEFVDDLEGVEERRMTEGAAPHEYLTSIETETPEDIVLGSNMLSFIESSAVSACGQRSWDVYRDVVVLDKAQAEVGEARGLSQQRVSQIVKEVQVALKAALLGAT